MQEQINIGFQHNDMPVLSLAGCYDKCRYAWLIRPCITRDVRVSSLVVDSEPCYHPLLIQMSN